MNSNKISLRWQSIFFQRNSWILIHQTEILCPNVTDPLNGVVVHVNNNVNGTLTYTCNKNYHVTSGNVSRVCSIKGSWSGIPPVCSGKCLHQNYVTRWKTCDFCPECLYFTYLKNGRGRMTPKCFFSRKSYFPSKNYIQSMYIVCFFNIMIIFYLPYLLLTNHFF